MSAYIVCLSINGGLPLFTRKYGDLKSVPFALLASLNGVSMFGDSHDVTLLNTITSDCRIHWRDFHNSIRLIICLSNESVSEFYIHTLLDNIFQSMILLSGIDDLVSLRHIDRIKKDMRAVFPMIDFLLSGLQPSEDTALFCDVIGGADIAIYPDQSQVSNHLENFTEAVDSTYGAVFVAGRIVCATNNWWSLHSDELSILSVYVYTEPSVTMSDTPVFLPIKSPTVPFRLVICRLTSIVQVAVLCGPLPSLPEIQTSIGTHWSSISNILQTAQALIPRCIPPSLNIDTSILGFVLVNCQKKRLLACMCPQISDLQRESRGVPISRRIEVLRSFYRSVVGSILPASSEPNPHTAEIAGSLVPDHPSHASLIHQASETFISSELHKCYALKTGPYQFFGMFLPTVPNHSVREISKRTLQILLKEKHNNLIKS